MRCPPQDIVRIGAAAAVSAVAVGYLWRYLSSDDKSKKKQDASPVKAGAASNGAAEGDKVSADDHIWIYFGSQSGTAEGFSNELEQEASNHGLSATVMDLEDFSPDDFVKHKLVILVVATYGEGDPTDNAVEFFKWLQDSGRESDEIEGMNFTVMGLGNRQYVNFNSVAKLADQRLEAIGAKRIHERGEGDDDQNIEEDFEQWKERGLWPALQQAAGAHLRQTSNQSGEARVIPTLEEVRSKLNLKVAIGDEKVIDPLVQNGGADILGKWYFQASAAPIVRNDELRQVRDEATGKTTRHIDFCIKHLPAMEWKTADNLEILPRNTDEVVEWFAGRLGVKDQLETSMTFVRAPGVDKAVKKIFPAPCLVRKALETYCDLVTAPPFPAARKFAALATDEEDLAFAESLLSDRETYRWLTGDGVHLSMRELLEVFLPSVEVDFGTFLQLCPRQKSRPYTIASSSREDPKKIGVCVGMVHEDGMPSLVDICQELRKRGIAVPSEETMNARFQKLGTASQRRIFDGATSTMLCTRSVRGDKLMIYARPSSFRLPKRTTTPIVMLGAGTGVAPFHAFLREFVSEGGVRPNTILFFGCQNSKEDFLYADEFDQAIKMAPKPALKELVSAFSREQAHKVYVQHRLKERKEQVEQYLKDGAYVYVCGSVNMGKSIKEEMIAILGSEAQLDRLQKEGRYVEELW